MNFEIEVTVVTPLHQLAATLTCAVYALSEYPEVFNRLRSEILEYVGFDQRPTYDDIHRMRYLRAFINGMFAHVIYSFGKRIVKEGFRGFTSLSPTVSTSQAIFLNYAHLTLYSPFNIR